MTSTKHVGFEKEKTKIKNVSDALALLDQVIQENYDYVTLLNMRLEELREGIGKEGGLHKK